MNDLSGLIGAGQATGKGLVICLSDFPQNKLKTALFAAHAFERIEDKLYILCAYKFVKDEVELGRAIQMASAIANQSGTPV